MGTPYPSLTVEGWPFQGQPPAVHMPPPPHASHSLITTRSPLPSSTGYTCHCTWPPGPALLSAMSPGKEKKHKVGCLLHSCCLYGPLRVTHGKFIAPRTEAVEKHPR